MVKRFFRSKAKKASSTEKPVDDFSHMPPEGVIDADKINDAASVIDEMFGTIPDEIYERVSVDTIGVDWHRRCIYHGSVYCVEWNIDETISHPNSELDAAIGINQEEAMAALISTEIQEDNGWTEEKRRDIEEMLVGFTHDLLAELDEPDGMAAFKNALHRETFHSVDSGIIFDYVSQDSSITPHPITGPTDKFPKIKTPQGEEYEYGAITASDAPSPVRASIATYGAPRYYESKDPVLMLSDQRLNTRGAPEGVYDPEGLTRVRTMLDLNTESQVSPELHSLFPWIPEEVHWLILESSMISKKIQESLPYRIYLDEYSKGKRPNSSIFMPLVSDSDEANKNAYSLTNDDTFPSHVAINIWSQAWVPILMDVTMEYFPDTSKWELGEVDYNRIIGNPLTSGNTKLSITRRLSITNASGKLLSEQIRRFLDDEDELEEEGGDGVINEETESQFNALMQEFSSRDLMTITLSGIDDTINDYHLGAALRAGLLTVQTMTLVDIYGQITDVDPTGLLNVMEGINEPKVSIGLSLEDETDQPSRIVLRPRIPKPSRLDFRLLCHDDDSLPAISISPNLTSGDPIDPLPNRTPVCGYLLPDHMEWAMEVFDYEGVAKGQLRVAKRNWSHGGIQKGMLAWDNAPGGPSTAGSEPNVGNPHMDVFLNSLMNIGMTDEIEPKGLGGEGVLSALLRSIDTTQWTIDPFAKGGPNHPSLYMGRPVAVVRAVMRLQVEGGENGMSDELRNHEFHVRMGSVARKIDGLLGYFVNDDYSRFNSVYPLNSDGSPEYPSTGSLDHPFIIFDPTIDLKPEENITLTLLMNPQSSIHITSGLLPQKEITLVREHWDSAVARIAPTFKIGPVLVDPQSIRMPIDDGKPNLIWSWTHRETPSEWVESPIKRSDSNAGLPQGKMTAYEGWIKLDIDENQDVGN